MKKHGISTLFPVLVMLMLAGLTFWLKEVMQAESPASGKQRHDPDYFAENFTVHRFGSDGRLHSTLRAPKMRHYPDDDTSTVDYPDLVYHGERKTTVTANSGWINGEATEVIFTDNVVVTRVGMPGEPSTVITSSKMYAYPDEETARTDQPVKITKGNSVVHGIGLDADNKTQIGTLHGRVRGTIYPKPKPK